MLIVLFVGEPMAGGLAWIPPEKSLAQRNKQFHVRIEWSTSCYREEASWVCSIGILMSPLMTRLHFRTRCVSFLAMVIRANVLGAMCSMSKHDIDGVISTTLGSEN